MKKLVDASRTLSQLELFCKLHPPLRYFSSEDWQVIARCCDAHKPLQAAAYYMAIVLEKVA
jgi:hypothetical protein